MDKLKRLLEWMINKRLLATGDKLKLRIKNKFIYIYIINKEI